MHRDFSAVVADHLAVAERRMSAAIIACNCNAFSAMARHLREAKAHIEEASRLAAENAFEAEDGGNDGNV